MRTHEKNENKKKDLAKMLFFVCLVGARGQIFLVFKAFAILRPLSNVFRSRQCPGIWLFR